PRPIREIIPEVPQWLCDIIAKLHAKKPEDRFASAKEVAEVMSRCLAELQLHGKVQAVEETARVAAPPALSSPVQNANPPLGEMFLKKASGPAPLRRRGRRLAVAAAFFLAMLAGLSLTEATGVTHFSGAVIRLFSADGTLIVEVDDPEVSVSIDGTDVVIKGAGVKEIRMKAGQYKVQASKDGTVVRQELVTVAKDGRQVLRISREVAPREVAPLPQGDPDRRAAEYVLSIGGRIQVSERASEITSAADLPRESFRLTYVKLFSNQQVSDAGLAAFKGCKHLTYLVLANTKVSDFGLACFKDCKPLAYLDLTATKAGDAGV